MAHKVIPGQEIVILTVNIAVPKAAFESGEAADCLSGLLSENGSCDPDSLVLDWQYAGRSDAAQALEVVAPSEEIEEGEIFEVARQEVESFVGVATEYFERQIEDGNLNAEQIPVRIARYGLTPPVQFINEIRERYEMMAEDVDEEEEQRLRCPYCDAGFSSFEINPGVGDALAEEHHREGEICPECLQGVLEKDEAF